MDMRWTKLRMRRRCGGDAAELRSCGKAIQQGGGNQSEDPVSDLPGSMGIVCEFTYSVRASNCSP